MKISYSKTFEKKFSKYDRKLQEKIFNAIQNLPNGDVKRLTGMTYLQFIELEHQNIEQILKVDSRGDIYK